VSCIGCYSLNQTIFCTSTSFKRSLVLDVIPDANLKIDSQKMATIIVALNANNRKIQQSCAKFCYLINVLWTFGQQQRRGDKMKRLPKKMLDWVQP
jgi:hypothetical protein